jgi:hypothetical protein
MKLTLADVARRLSDAELALRIQFAHVDVRDFIKWWLIR